MMRPARFNVSTRRRARLPFAARGIRGTSTPCRQRCRFAIQGLPASYRALLTRHGCAAERAVQTNVHRSRCCCEFRTRHGNRVRPTNATALSAETEAEAEAEARVIKSHTMRSCRRTVCCISGATLHIARCVLCALLNGSLWKFIQAAVAMSSASCSQTRPRTTNSQMWRTHVMYCSSSQSLPVSYATSNDCGTNGAIGETLPR